VHRALLRFGQILSLAALFVACGGHWAVMQSYAWARMLVENSENSRFVVAVEKTFDGQHPCDICKSIETAKGKEKKAPQTIQVSKTPLVCQESGCDLYPSEGGLAPRSGAMEAMVRKTKPAAPPPRSGAV
jgi:hypothetical protein